MYKPIRMLETHNLCESFLAQDIKDGHNLALKCFTKKDSKALQAGIRDAQFASWLQSAQLIKLINAFDYKGRLCFFVEYMDGGNMTKIIQDMKLELSEDFCRWTLYQVSLGLQYMHARNVLHRDIKCDNVYCATNGDIKIGNFYHSVMLSSELIERELF